MGNALCYRRIAIWETGLTAPQVLHMILGKLLALDQTIEVDSPLSVLAIVMLGMMASAILFISPVLIGSMVELLEFTDAQAGYVVSAELAGMSLAALPALYWAPRVNWRVALLLALCAVIVGNFVSAAFVDFYSLVTMRFLVGLAGGSAMAICLATIGLTRDPDRTFGLWVTGQLRFGAIGLFVLPRTLSVTGYGFIYIVIAIMITGLLFLLRFLPQYGHPVSKADSPRLPDARHFSGLVLGTGGLLAIFVFYVGQYGIWAYLDRMGAAAGLQQETIGEALSLATIIGVMGALSAAVLSARYGRLLPIAVGSGISICAMGLLLDGFGFYRYVLATCIFSFTFNFILPYLMACVASIDDTGRLIILSNMSSGAGLAAGPALAAVLQVSFGYTAVISAGVIFTGLSLLLIGKLAVIHSSPGQSHHTSPS